MSRSESVVSCQGLAKIYEGDVPVEALRDATFTVGAGEQVVICGPSGSGKSTLLNLLGLLDSPSIGSYQLIGEDVSGLGERDRAGLRAEVLGFIFQSFHLVRGRTAAENVAAGLLYQGIDHRTRMRRAREVLERVGLEKRADSDVTQLSGGERQRVAIARAVVHEPRLLLADEPTGNLDSSTSERILDLLDELNGAGFTQIIVTHNEAIVRRITRRLDVMDGVLVDSTGHE